MQCPAGLLLSSCAALGWLLHSSVLSFLIYKCGYSRGSPAGRGASSNLVVRLSSDQRWAVTSAVCSRPLLTKGGWREPWRSLCTSLTSRDEEGV